MANAQQIDSANANAELLAALRKELAFSEPPLTIFEARRAARRATERGENFLNSLGYFSPQITYAVEPGEPPKVALNFEPGPVFTFAKISIDTGTNQLSPEAREALDSVRVDSKDDAAIPKAIIAEEAGLIAALKAVGHADARILERLVIGDRVAGTIDLTYRIDPGPRVQLGRVIYDSDTRVRQTFLDRLIPFEKGEFYSPQALAAFNRRLNATRSFSFVSAQLSKTATEKVADGVEMRDVLVQLEDRDRYTLSAGASFFQ